MGVLNFEAIKKAATITRDVAVEEWGGVVRLAKLGVKAKINLKRFYDQLPKDADGRPVEDSEELIGFLVAVVSHSVVDEHGAATFAGAMGRDVLSRVDPAILVRLANAAIELNGFDVEAAAGELAEKN